MNKKIIGFLALVIVAVVLGFVGKSIFDAEKAEINERPAVKVGIIYPLSGHAADLGEAAQNAVLLYLDKFEQGQHAFRYQIIFEDSEMNSEKASDIAKRMIETDKVDVLATLGSEVSNAVVPLANENNVLHFSITTDLAAAKGKYNFVATSYAEDVKSEPVEYEGVAFKSAATKAYQEAFGNKSTHYSEYLYAVLEVLTNTYNKMDTVSIHNREAVVEKIINESSGVESAAGVVQIDENGVINTQMAETKE